MELFSTAKIRKTQLFVLKKVGKKYWQKALIIQNTKSSKNFVSYLSSITLLAAILLVEKTNTDVKVEVLFDQGSQRSYMTKPMKELLC